MHVGAIGEQHNKTRRLKGFLGVLVWLAALHGVPVLAADRECASVLARVVSIQGKLEVLRARSDQWEQVTRLDTSVCQGDRLRTKARSRAALFVRPETVTRIDENTTVAISQSSEGTELEFFDPESAPDINRGSSCGKLYAITRFPKKFKAKSRLVSGSVEGTEFQLAMRCESTELSVFEGKVLAEFLATNAEPVKVSSGESVTAGEVAAEAVKLIVSPIDAVQWALYYPPILDAKTEPASADDCKSLEPTLSHACFVERADQLLRVGRVDEANEEVQQALAADPNGGEAHAILAIIKVVKNDKAGALEEAKRATEASPNSMRAWLALSYAQQAHFALEAALESAQQAARLGQGSALTHARVAELLMSLGRIGAAEKEAKLAVEAQPKQSRAHLILGFVHLAQINTNLAKEDFLQAIELDSSDPLARLGLGLAMIREGHLQQGREEIEIAVGLDPTNSLVRSYVGKAYYEENSKDRDQLAEAQFTLAKQYDERDPTPWFYDAILKQTQNRPVEALQSLQKSIELNDNRAMYRSRLMLDEDAAARSISQATIYREVGFDQLARSEAYGSLNSDPGNWSAHQFLADVYLNEPRADVARLSEQLQSQLRQPQVMAPISLQLSSDKLFASRTAGPQVIGFNEYASLFDRNRIQLSADGMSGSFGTSGEQVTLSGIEGKISFALAQLHYETDGFRENNDLKKDIFDAFIQTKISDRLSVQAEVRATETKNGDLPLRFDPQNFSSDRETERVGDIRVGARYEIDERSDIIASLRYDNGSATAVIPQIVSFYAKNAAYVAEIQHLIVLQNGSVISGLGYYDVHPTLKLDSIDLQESDGSHTNAYVYGQIRTPWLRFTLLPGMSYDDVDYNGVRFSKFNPKIGAIWQPIEGTRVRTVYAKVVKRSFVAGQTLEPAQVAGFVQFYDDPDATQSQLRGIGIDQTISNKVFVGAESVHRDLNLPPLVDDPTFPFRDWHDRSGRAYFNWILNSRSTLALEYLYEQFERPPENSGNEQFVDVTTRRVPISLSLFSATAWSTKLSVSHVDQSGTFTDSTGNLFQGGSHFWVTDVGLFYRLPDRHGILAFEVRNLFDKTFQFQEIDNTWRIAPRRFVTARINLSF